MSRAAIPSLLLAACGASQMRLDDQLEAPSVEVDGEEREVKTTFVTGSASVEGEGREFALSDGDATWSLAVHTPGESALDSLDGRGLTVEVHTWEVEESNGELAAAIQVSDGDGLVYVAAGPENGKRLARDLFGEDFATFGEALGEDVGYVYGDEEQRVEFHAVVLATDDGPVRVDPGEATHIAVGGQRWRFTLHTAFRAIADDGGMFFKNKCGGDDVRAMGFEMLRIEGEPGADVVLAPEEGRGSRVMAGGC